MTTLKSWGMLGVLLLGTTTVLARNDPPAGRRPGDDRHPARCRAGARLCWLARSILPCMAGYGDLGSDSGRPRLTGTLPASGATWGIDFRSIERQVIDMSAKDRGVRSPRTTTAPTAYSVDLHSHPCPPAGSVTYQDEQHRRDRGLPALSGGTYREVWFRSLRPRR